MAVVICPGGGYAGLAIQHEGSEFAKWLNGQGITAFVLKYRMPNKHKEVPLDDAQQAMRYVRKHANEFGIDANKVGIAGFSAGGHLAATTSTHYTTEGTSTKPDFSILFYPVITMEMATHGGSRSNLLGDKPLPEDIQFFSNEKQINANTPPAILLLSDDDKSVSPVNSVFYYEALKKNNIPATMYIFPKGGHGWGIGSNIARMIVNYRERLGGFFRIEQLQEIHLKAEKLRPWFSIDTHQTRRINLNKAGMERMMHHPYINYYQAKVIIEYRKKKGFLKSLKQLSLYEEFTPIDLERLEPYICYN